jgi:hypothetical protein
VIIRVSNRVLIIALPLLMLIIAANAAFAAPEGAYNITQIASERRTPLGGAQVSAQGGNITTLSIITKSQSKAWQGFVGNISGTIVLDNAANSTFYSWNITNITGEIYASRNSSINWNIIYAVNDCAVDEDLTGKNSERTSKTFDPSSNTVNFSVGTIAINSSSACAALTNINNTKQKQLGTNLFENVILINSNSSTNATIYTGVLQNGVSGFDTQLYNFQLLVPVNHTSGFSTYYIYAELD